ncbi:MAG: nucleotidyl transferase AbiEii/AbiGii toxin family protein [Patescibacteria group bacterium]
MLKLQTQFYWQNILETAKIEGYPLNKKRALIREYLQSKFLYFLYMQKESAKLSFIGGTSLRLLHNLDRFSEDLDFDNLGLKNNVLRSILNKTAKQISKLGFALEFNLKIQNKTGVGYLKFAEGLLKNIGASQDPKEKLHIKIDIKEPEIGVKPNVCLLTKFDCAQNIVSHNLETLLSQKTLAFLRRKSPRGRDIYDIFWLMSKNIKPNIKVLQKFGIKNTADYWQALAKKYAELQPKMKYLKKQLQPFLFDEAKIKYLDMFKTLLKSA